MKQNSSCDIQNQENILDVETPIICPTKEIQRDKLRKIMATVFSGLGM
jgi:hypothetical protein